MVARQFFFVPLCSGARCAPACFGVLGLRSGLHSGLLSARKTVLATVARLPEACLWYPSSQCVDGEGFARRVWLKRGKVMGCKPS